jgi:hypothetical protein
VAEAERGRCREAVAGAGVEADSAAAEEEEAVGGMRRAELLPLLLRLLFVLGVV